MFFQISPLVILIAMVQSILSSTEQPANLKNFQLLHHNGSLTEENIGTNIENIGTLEIIYSHITKLSNDDLKHFTNLENLTISHSEFERLDDDLFANCCPKLKHLAINNLKEFNEKDFAGIGTLPLERLEINNQNIPIIKTGTFKHGNLQSLSLSECNIEKIEDGAFNGLDKLEFLLIAKNKLNSIPKKALEPLRNLQTLELESNGIENISTEDFPKLPNFTDLVVIRENLKHVDFEGIHKVAPKLADVFIIGVKDVHTKELKGLPRIHIEN